MYCYINAPVSIYNDFGVPETISWEILDEYGTSIDQGTEVLNQYGTKRFDPFYNETLRVCRSRFNRCIKNPRGYVPLSTI